MIGSKIVPDLTALNLENATIGHAQYLLPQIQVVIIPFIKCPASEAKVTGLWDMTLKTEVPCHSRC